MLSQETNTNMKNKALLIIDIQMFYFPGGSVPLVEPEAAAMNASKILEYARNNNMLVIHIKHDSKAGSDIHSLVSPVEGEKIITKKEYFEQLPKRGTDREIVLTSYAIAPFLYRCKERVRCAG